jgi:two-component system NtrC family sensor kinase
LTRPLSGVRILVIEPAPGAASPHTVDALLRLGPEVDLEVARDAVASLARLARGDLDLVVLDLGLGAQAQQILGALPPGAPPVLAVTADPREETSVEAFARGAADCIGVSSDFAACLAAAALEQIRRFRAASEWRRLEDDVEELRRTNENVIQNMNSALLLVDAGARVTFANPAAEQVLGVPAGHLRGTSVFELFADASPASSPPARALAEGVRVRGVEATLRRGERGCIPVALSCAPLLDAGGGRRGAVLLFEDLTEIQRLQRQVLQQEKMASIGQLAAGIAHEINNPMGFVHANLLQMAEYVNDLARAWDAVGVLRKAVEAGGAGEARAAAEQLAGLAAELDVDFLLADLAKAVRESQEGAERIRHIVQDLRVFSHARGERAPADLNRCLDSTANIVWTMLKHTVRLEKDYGELPPVACRAVEIQQVFMNLLVNAYQAIRARGAPPDGRGEWGVIRLRTRARGDGILVTVSDTGVGIPPEHRDRIFDPFFTTKEVGEGMGLGLSTSWDIVRRHGGRLTLESEVGRGTTFEVFLPFAAPEAGEAPA